MIASELSNIVRLEVGQELQRCAVDNAMSWDVAQCALVLEVDQCARTTVESWSVLPANVEYVTYNGVMVTHNGKPVWVVMTDL